MYLFVLELLDNVLLDNNNYVPKNYLIRHIQVLEKLLDNCSIKEKVCILFHIL